MRRNVVIAGVLVVALAAVAVLAVAQPWSGHGSADHASMHHDLSDGDFVAGMIPHHQGAVDMAQVVLDRSERPELRRFAQDIIDAQDAEIAQMRGWQADGTVGDGDASSMDAMMHGMSADELRSADDVDKAFLDAMIPHHEGAVMMAESVKATTGNPEIANLADAIIASQQREIDQMRQWRSDWYGK